MTRSVALTLVALALAGALWWLGNATEASLGLDDLGLLGPVAFVFAGLTALERILARTPAAHTHGDAPHDPLNQL